MEELKVRLNNLKEKLNIPIQQKQLKELENEAARPELWKDYKHGQTVMQGIATIKKVLEDIKSVELLLLDSDSKNETTAKEKIKELELRTFLNGPYDQGPAFLSIHAGQGGTEACDWAEMLERMYKRYAESQGWQTEQLEKTPGEEVGIKSVTY